VSKSGSFSDRGLQRGLGQDDAVIGPSFTDAFATDVAVASQSGGHANRAGPPGKRCLRLAQADIEALPTYVRFLGAKRTSRSTLGQRLELLVPLNGESRAGRRVRELAVVDLRGWLR
jgi:hypothetical protein